MDIFYLNFRIPIKIKTTMAITIAQSKPNIHQPIKKATTDNSPNAPQFIDIAIENTIH